MGPIYTDNGASLDLRTRYFRQNGEGIEWIFAADYAGPFPRWYGFGLSPRTMANLLKTHHTPLTLLETSE